MTFVLSGLWRSGKLLQKKKKKKKKITQKGNAHALQALFPLRRRLLPVRGLLQKSSTPRHPLLLPFLQESRLRGWGLGMHLVLRPVRLPLLPLDLGPARGVEVSLVARPVRVSALLPPLLGRGKLLVRSGRPLPAPLPRLPLPAHHSTLCDVVSRDSLRRFAPVLDPPMFPGLRIEEQGRIVGPALGRPALVTGPVDLALALFLACGRERRRRASSRSLSSCERLRSSDRSRSRRVRSRRDHSWHDRSRSSDRYRSRRQRSQSLARRGGRRDCSRSSDPPLRSRDRSRSRARSCTTSDRSRSKEGGRRASVRSRRVRKQWLFRKLLLSLRRLLQ